MFRQFVLSLAVISLISSTAPARAQLTIGVELGGIGHEMVFDESRDSIYVTVPSLNEVVIVSSINYTVLDRIIVGATPRGIDDTVRDSLPRPSGGRARTACRSRRRRPSS